jgi:colanic acid/amylovoran biosynthesis glycosyltransferase
LASGLPCISTRVAGVPEIVEDEITGLLTAPGSPSQLAEAIERILLTPELRKYLARRGRMKAERHFDLRQNAGKLRRLFMQSIALDKGGVSENLLYVS